MPSIYDFFCTVIGTAFFQVPTNLPLVTMQRSHLDEFQHLQKPLSVKLKPNKVQKDALELFFSKVYREKRKNSIWYYKTLSNMEEKIQQSTLSDPLVPAIDLN